MSLPNLPGGVSPLWALIYLLVGFFGIPFVLSFFARFTGGGKTEK